MWSSEVKAPSIWKWDKPGRLDDLHPVRSMTMSQAAVQSQFGWGKWNSRTWGKRETILFSDVRGHIHFKSFLGLTLITSSKDLCVDHHQLSPSFRPVLWLSSLTTALCCLHQLPLPCHFHLVSPSASSSSCQEGWGARIVISFFLWI